MIAISQLCFATVNEKKKSNLTYDPVSPVAFTQFYCKEKRSARNRDLLTLESEEDYESLIN